MSGWKWQDAFLMMMTHSLRQLVWVKTKDAQKKKNAPELYGPAHVLKAIKEAEKRNKISKGEVRIIKGRAFETSAELDEYLKRPRVEIPEAAVRDPLRKKAKATPVKKPTTEPKKIQVSDDII